MSASTYIRENKSDDTLAIGTGIGNAIGGTAVGVSSGINDKSVCVGYEAGLDCGVGSVCIGRLSGRNAGDNSIYIGNFAGATTAVSLDNTIMISAVGNNQTPDVSNSCYILPIRSSDGGDYFRSIEYRNVILLPKTQNGGTTYRLGTFTVDPSSVCQSISMNAKALPFLESSPPYAISFRITLTYRVKDASNNILETTTTNYPRIVKFPDGTYDPSGLFMNFTLNPNLYDNSGATAKVFTAEVVVDTDIPVNDPSYGNAVSGIYLGKFDGFTKRGGFIYDGGFNLRGNWSVGTNALPLLHYDPDSGEITYSPQ
jgi:hypothetical protein